jgi:hypothetical protein
MARDRLSLDGTWNFWCDPDGKALGCNTVANLPKTGWRRAVVPAPWQAQFKDLCMRGGTAWYRRTFETPSAWSGEQSVLLHFGAVDYYAQVWLNGVFLGDHEGGYLPFEFEVGHLLQLANDLVVRVIDPSDDRYKCPDFPFAEIPHGKQNWYGQTSGIWQSVWLERRPPFHIRTVRLTPNLQTGRVHACLDFSRPAGEGQTLSITVRDPEGAAIASSRVPVPAGNETVDMVVTVDQPLAWSPSHPHLYTFEARLLASKGQKDVQSEPFGFRTIETCNGQILLNGNPLYLRGVLDQGYYPDTIYTPPSVDLLEDQLRKAKAMGMNLLRCHIKIADPRYYEVADRLGMLIWTELPSFALFSDRAAQRARETMQGMVERDWNHPSIIAWTIINEDWGTELVHIGEHRAWLKDTYRWLKELDPTRLVVDNSPCWPNFHLQTDLEDYHHYRAIPDHRGEWDEFVSAFASRPDWTFSSHGDAVRTGDEPLLVSEFGNWGLPDPDKLRDEGGCLPWWFESGHDWADGAAYPLGVWHRFHGWHLDRVFGDWPAFVEATQWQQYHALKYQIEAIRRRPEISGYVLTELTDVHWEANGLMDMRRNLKAFGTLLAALNTDTAIIPEWERVAYWSGEPVRIGLTVAHASDAALQGCQLEWELTPSGVTGSVQVPELRPGEVWRAGTAVFQAPVVEISTRQQLEMTLCSANGHQLASNCLALTFFPQLHETRPSHLSLWSPEPRLAEYMLALGYQIALNPDAADAVITHRLDGSLMETVRGGGRVLLLANQSRAIEHVFPDSCAVEPWFPNVRLVARQGSIWDGDWVSTFAWVRREGPFTRFPGGPLLDHSFDGVIPEYVLTGFSAGDFDAYVHAGIIAGWVHHPAVLVGEQYWGKGRAVLTTLELTDDAPGADPTATTLLDALIELTLGT